MTLFQGHMNARKQNLQCHLFHKVLNWFGCWDFLIWWTTCLFCFLIWWTTCSFCVVWSVFKEENPAYVILFLKKNFNVIFFSVICKLISFKLGLMIETTKLSFDDHDHHLRSQLYEKSETFVSIFTEFHCWFGFYSVCCHNLLVCWKSCKIYFAWLQTCPHLAWILLLMDQLLVNLFVVTDATKV